MIINIRKKTENILTNLFLVFNVIALISEYALMILLYVVKNEAFQEILGAISSYGLLFFILELLFIGFIYALNWVGIIKVNRMDNDYKGPVFLFDIIYRLRNNVAYKVRSFMGRIERRKRYSDPINCELYKDKGCSHIDGIICDYPYCEMRRDYVRNKYDLNE